MKYLIGMDLGTSGTKTVLFDQNGGVVASALGEYPLYQPRNGWAEQDPADWWNAARETLSQVLAEGGVDPEDIVGLGISGQMHGLVMLDERGEVLRPSIIWCDQRTGEQCREITEKVGAERLVEITANPALTGFTASKLLWVREHEPRLYERCRHILLPKDYLRYKLTGDFATEVSDASGMQLLDVSRRQWSEEVLERLSIDPALLGRVYESPEVTGRISPSAAVLTGLSERTVVVGGAGDNAAAAVGTGVVTDGSAFVTIGSSGVVYAHCDRMAVDPAGRVHTFCCAVPGAWHVMGVTQGAGISLRWFRDEFCNEEKAEAERLGTGVYKLMDGQAAKIPIGAERLIFLPYLMGERTPHLDPDCRGVFFGLSAMHTKRHLLRAVMEGVSYSLYDCLLVLEEMGISPGTLLACGGGGGSPLWRQMLADLFGRPVATVSAKEGPALGAAILAGVGAGIYPDVPGACGAMIRTNPVQPPIEENTTAYRRVHGVYRSLYPRLKPVYPELAGL